MDVDLTHSFWEDIPVNILEDVYKQLEGDGLDTMDSMMDDTDSNPTPPHQNSTSSVQNQSLPALFTTPSMTDISSIHGGLPFQMNDNPATLESQKSINRIAQLHDHQQEQIRKLTILQKQICQNGHSSTEDLKSQQFVLNQQINGELKQLRDLNKSTVLEPAELHKSRILGQRLQIQQQELELLCKELTLIGQDIMDPLGMLVIEDQPIPQVTFKGKSLDDNYTIRLLSGANVTYQNISKIKAQLVSDDNKKWKQKNLLENDTTTMEFHTRIATFHHLKINVSTRMTPIHLKFGIQVQQITGVSPVIQSHPSYPLIVITNESQWCEAEGKLVIMDSFAGQMEVNWAQFANGLHHHFLKATRQEPGKPARCIKSHEFDFIHKKFFNGRATITTQQASRFWGWFGQVTQTLRFKRHIATMWFNGLIYGLITKEEAHSALVNQQQGTFLIRFSESYPGLFGIAYVSDDPEERVKHYLVKPDDTGSQKSLPDFLREKPQFKFIYLLDVVTGILSPEPKDILKVFIQNQKH